ncbi:D-alanyl-D-alanine carboxypeptidase DacB precursor [compost metagenome]
MFRKKLFLFVILALCVFLFLVNDQFSWASIKQHTVSFIDQVESGTQGRARIELADLQGEAVLMMDRETGEVIYSDHEKKRMYPASTTKILTALILLEHANPDDLVTVGNEVAIRTTGESSAGLQPGDVLTVRDLVAAMMLPSGNDAARAVASYVAHKDSGKELDSEESVAYFAKMMNKRAKSIGAKKSHFVNPHGLHDPDHYTTAYDMALIAKKAMANSEFQAIVGESVHQSKDQGQGGFIYENRNKLLKDNEEWYFQGANGVKTGYTEKAGYCLVGSATRDQKELITVVLHSSEQGVWSDTVKLLNYGFKIEG